MNDAGGGRRRRRLRPARGRPRADPPPGGPARASTASRSCATCGWTSPATEPRKSMPASNWAACRCMTQTVEALLGQHIDHTVMLDFQGFAALTDALGGVDVNVRLPFPSTVDDTVHFPAGREPAQRAAGAGLCPRAPRLRRRRLPAGPEPADLPEGRDGQAGIRRQPGGPRHRPQTRPDGAAARDADPSFTLESLENLAFSLRSTAPGRGVFFTLPTAGHRYQPGRPVDCPAGPRRDRRGVRRAGSGRRSPSYVAANNLQNGN